MLGPGEAGTEGPGVDPGVEAPGVPVGGTAGVGVGVGVGDPGFALGLPDAGGAPDDAGLLEGSEIDTHPAQTRTAPKANATSRLTGLSPIARVMAELWQQIDRHRNWL